MILKKEKIGMGGNNPRRAFGQESAGLGEEFAPPTHQESRQT